jgi:hypothetical protein
MAHDTLHTASTYDRSRDQVGASTHKRGWAVIAITATLALDCTYPNVLKIDPSGAARDVTLDAVATCPGLMRKIINGADAAENLVLKNVGGDTIATVNQNEEADVVCDGATWVLLAVRTIALS